MTDRLLSTSQELRAEGDDLRNEIDRHAKAMYDRIERMQQRLHGEIAELEALKKRFGWVGPELVGQQQIQQRIRAVEASKGRTNEER